MFSQMLKDYLGLHTVQLSSSKPSCALKTEGIKLIQTIRGEGDPYIQQGDSFIMLRMTPGIDFHAPRIGDLISYSEDISEQPLPCSLDTS